MLFLWFLALYIGFVLVHTFPSAYSLFLFFCFIASYQHPNHSDEVDRFEIKTKRFVPSLEEGIEVTLWQLSRKIELGGEEKDEFGLKSTAVAVKLHKRGDMYVQAVLAFTLRGGYLTKAIGRHRGKDVSQSDNE